MFFSFSFVSISSMTLMSYKLPENKPLWRRCSKHIICSLVPQAYFTKSKLGQCEIWGVNKPSGLAASLFRTAKRGSCIPSAFSIWYTSLLNKKISHMNLDFVCVCVYIVWKKTNKRWFSYSTHAQFSLKLFKWCFKPMFKPLLTKMSRRIIY